MAYLDKTGLTYFWNKIKVLLTNKADKTHGHTLDEVSETTSKKIMTSAERTKLNGIATGANNYSHPSTHPASMITGLATVATSGNYNDLSNKPTIPTIPTSLPANGGNADTVDGYHIVVSSTAPTVNDPNVITIVI